MKVVTPAEMSRIEKLAYDAGASEEEFMDQAGRGVALAVAEFIELHGLGKKIALLAGKGNNAGDGYVAGRVLLEAGLEVFAFQLSPIEECSPLCQKNLEAFQKAGGEIVGETPKAQRLAQNFDLLIDGVFGTGFHGTVSGTYFNALDAARRSEVPSIAIDIPSGLSGETGEIGGVCLPAAMTLFLGLPKTGFFLGEGWNMVGELHGVDFGLEENFIREAKESFTLFTHPQAARLMPPIKRSRHKYQAGFVMGVAGSPGMSGAAKLSCLAALRGGAGMVRLLRPEGMEAELSDAPYELIQLSYRPGEAADHFPIFEKADAVFFGPGIGRGADAEKLVDDLLPKIQKPLVLDADALTLLAGNPKKIPKGALLTPHAGEMARLLKVETPQTITFEFLSRCKAFAKEHKVYLVLKGGPSWIITPAEELYVSTAGSPGMATAGSGDVLTGLLAALLSQGLDPRSAALLGVHLHGLAGEAAAERMSPYCMIASDIIDAFPRAFWALLTN